MNNIDWQQLINNIAMLELTEQDKNVYFEHSSKIAHEILYHVIHYIIAEELRNWVNHYENK